MDKGAGTRDTTPHGTVFASLRKAERVWAVASIHGEAHRLRRLHSALREKLKPGDRVVYSGNAMGHGPEIGAVIDEIMAFRRYVLAQRNALVFDVAILRGAQEEMWQKTLQLQFAVNPSEVLDWMLDQGVGATLEAYGSDADEARTAARTGTMAITRWTSNLRSAFQASGHQAWLSALKHAALTRKTHCCSSAGDCGPTCRWMPRTTCSGGAAAGLTGFRTVPDLQQGGTGLRSATSRGSDRRPYDNARRRLRVRRTVAGRLHNR